MSIGLFGETVCAGSLVDVALESSFLCVTTLLAFMLMEIRSFKWREIFSASQSLVPATLSALETTIFNTEKIEVDVNGP